MNAIIWNIRLVNTKKAFERFVTMHRQYEFQFIGLMEHVQNANKVEKYRRKLGIHHAFVNISNKVWAFVEEDYEVDILFDMEQQLTLILFNPLSQKDFIVTLVYAKCDAIERIELWDSMYALAQDMNVLWLVDGDFNVIVYEEEKIGGIPVSLNEVEDFRHCINTCNLFDLDFKGSIYTWWNGRTNDDRISKRLDRCLAKIKFKHMLHGVVATHLSKTSFDHCPLIISCDLNAAPIKKSFKFLMFSIKHQTFLDVLKENWTSD
ncbi:uncharacterized protein LOC142171714 [Nicotiana tabacum]|uniref:Uncharacterized protein LOC142171714 n=1 Tax=Nicotiana tabacum TaxID=4097 RepID=A0AC58T2S9_TOBAC